MHEYYRAKMALAIIKTLTEYEQAPTVLPINDEHELGLGMEGLCQLLPAKTLPQEGRQHWNDLVGNSTRDLAVAKRCAGSLADWLGEHYVRTPRLMISLEECSLILDGELYIHLDPVALTILHYLQQQAGRPVTLEAIQKNVKGCHRDERGLRRCLERLEDQINQRPQAPETPAEPVGPAQRIRLIRSRPGAGHWLELPHHPVH